MVEPLGFIALDQLQILLLPELSLIISDYHLMSIARLQNLQFRIEFMKFFHFSLSPCETHGNSRWCVSTPQTHGISELQPAN